MLAIIRRLNNLIDECRYEKPKRLIAQLTSLKDANPELLEYLTEILKNVEIKLGGCSEEKAIDLINRNLLESWCWQSSETCALMFQDTDYVERGNLYFNDEKTNEYFHSWISFEFDCKEYVLDPSLNFLCPKEKYFKTFNVELKGVVTVGELKQEFKKQIKNKQAKIKSISKFKSVENPHIVIDGVEDVFAPFFRSDIGCVATIENDEIKSITANYYYRN